MKEFSIYKINIHNENNREEKNGKGKVSMKFKKWISYSFHSIGKLQTIMIKQLKEATRSS